MPIFVCGRVCTVRRPICCIGGLSCLVIHPSHVVRVTGCSAVGSAYGWGETSQWLVARPETDCKLAYSKLRRGRDRFADKVCKYDCDRGDRTATVTCTTFESILDISGCSAVGSAYGWGP